MSYSNEFLSEIDFLFGAYQTELEKFGQLKINDKSILYIQSIEFWPILKKSAEFG